MVKRIVGVLTGFLLAGAGVIALAHTYVGRAATVTQPIAFNHQIHVTRAGLDCTTVCHVAATTEVYAGMPSKDVCFECHDPDDDETSENSEKARLAGYVDADADIPWQRVAMTRPDVFFSHRRHVTGGKIECLRCHPGVEESAEPLTQVSLVLRMASCLDCHEHEGADVDCLACHR